MLYKFNVRVSVLWILFIVIDSVVFVKFYFQENDKTYNYLNFQVHYKYINALKSIRKLFDEIVCILYNHVFW